MNSKKEFEKMETKGTVIERNKFGMVIFKLKTKRKRGQQNNNICTHTKKHCKDTKKAE